MNFQGKTPLNNNKSSVDGTFKNINKRILAPETKIRQTPYSDFSLQNTSG